ncbi:MAG: GAF domain-containing protein [Candidatus Competibacter sp.]|nr:GAF domain-containing protein [Candidatus Competibacter sp.]HRD50833.1 GAF domain-containing protein [Candidatus Contendobacter sp.]
MPTELNTVEIIPHHDGHNGRRHPIWAVVFTLIALALLVGGYGYYRVEAARIRQEKYQDIAAIGELKVGQILQWRRERLADARRAAGNPFLRRALATWRTTPNAPDLSADGQESLQLEQEAYGYANVLLLDPDGKLLLTVSDNSDPADPATKRAIAATLAGRNAALSDFYRAPDGRIYLDALAPVSDAEGRPLAVLVLRSDAAFYLYPLIQSWPTPSRSAETLLVRREGDAVIFLNELRHQAQAALSLHIPLAQSDLPAVQAVLGRQGLFQGQDYHGMEVLADLRPVPGSPWFLVTKMDVAEILAEARYRAGVVTLFISLGLLLAATATAWAYRRRQASLYRELYQAEWEQRAAQEAFRATLYSIGDAIITTDNAGRIRQMNRVAEQLTGWPETEAQGQPLDNVFRIVSEKTHAVVENPAQRVLRERAVVGLANHTLLIARDGTEHPISNSGAPIRDKRGAITGVVLIFRDQTEERTADQALRESERRFRWAVMEAPFPIMIYAEDGEVLVLSRAWKNLTGYDETDIPTVADWTERAYGVRQEQVQSVIDHLYTAGRRQTDGALTLTCKDGAQRIWEFSSTPLGRLPDGRRLVVSMAADLTERQRAEEEVRRNEARMRSLVSILQYQTDSVQEFLDYALNEAIELTGSTIGYLYRYYEDRREFVLNSWSREVMRECNIVNSQTCYELDKTGLWGEAVRQRRPILVNDFAAAHPLKKGYPDGHAELRKYLTVPVFSRGNIVGVVGVANKSADYHETDILQLTLLMEAVWKVVERRQAEDNERQAVRSFRMLSRCNKAIALAQEDAGLMQEICHILVAEGGWRLAWVGLADPGPGKRVRPVAQFGFEDGYLEAIKITWDDSPTGQGPTGAAIRTGQPVICYNLHTDPRFAPWREEAARYGYAASIALPLAHKTGVFGALSLYAADSDALAPDEVDLLRRLADNLAYALRVLRMKAAGEQAIRKHDALEAQLHQARKMEAVGRLAGGVAHDFNNMLAVIAGHADLALEQTAPDSALHADLLVIQEAAQRSADLTRQLLAFARKQTIAPQALDLNDTIAGMLKMLRRLISEDMELLWKPAGSLWRVNMDPAQIDQILANLVVNARDAIAGVGKITIETGQAEFDETYCETHPDFIPGYYVLLAVSDNGCGMDQEILAQLFDPFFTTKPQGRGTGLGLATVYGIVKQNHGFIHVYSEPGKGTTFKIYLPRHESDPISARRVPASAVAPTGSETVLLVEDEEALLKLGKILLERLGYTVLAADGPNQALQRVETYAGPIHLLLTDVIMPDMNGRDLWQRLSALRPGLKCLFMSGYTANVIAHHGVLDEGVHFLQKPFSNKALATKLREALHGP